MAEDRWPTEPAEGGPFPVYRRLAEGHHFYRIEDSQHFTEIQRVGGRLVLHHVEARAYPELVRIAEMLGGDGGRFVAITAEEWEDLLGAM